MPAVLPDDIRALLRQASVKSAAQLQKKFTCDIFDSPWDQFVELWAPRIYALVFNALGPYGMEPKSEILKLQDGHHIAGATASFDPSSGQIRLSTSIEDNPGQTLEKMVHEMIHGSLAQFPEGDPFYEEGYVDYSVWVVAHAPVWDSHQTAMIQSAANNIKIRRERAMKGGSDWDKKRWAGGLYAALSMGPYVISTLKQRKMERTFFW